MQGSETPEHQAEYQKDEVAEEKALQKLHDLSDEDFDRLKDILLEDIEEGGPNEGAVESHVWQVLAIGLKLAENFETQDEKRLITLLHDKKKTPGDFSNLFTHASQSAEAIPEYLESLPYHNRERKPLRTEITPTLVDFLKNSRELSLFISKVVETHSAIPFIENAFNYDQLQKIKEHSGEAALPYLKQKSLEETGTYYGLPYPTEKYGNLLRAADTLSNYGIIPDLVVPIRETVDPYLAKYAGFLKIVRLDRGATIQERMTNIAKCGGEAVDAGIYDSYLTAKGLAEKSCVKALWLARYFAKSSETVTVGDEVIPVDMLESKRSEAKGFEGKVRTIDAVLNGIYTKAFRALELTEGRSP